MNPINRRTFIKSVGAAATGAAAFPSGVFAGSASSARRLNVVMMVADDQRNDTIAALGNDHIQTPNLDHLVKSGFAFKHAKCMGSQLPAVCVPTRAMLHTGRSLFHVPGNLEGFPTIGQTLQAAGYRTFLCGKWHNGTPGFARSFSGGGNIFFGGMHADPFKMPVRDFDPTGKYPASAIHTGNKFSSELFTDSAIDFIDSHGKEGPFFCYLAFTSPHDPRTPPAPYATMYDPAKMPLPKNWLPEHPFDNGELKVRDEKLAPFPRTEPDTRKQLCDYYGMITSQDAQVGRVLKALDDRGLTEDTLVIYTGDHGLAIGSHGLFGKQNVYEHSQNIPLIISGPKIPHVRTSDAMVYAFDIFPTLCDLLDVPPPVTLEGKNLVGVISGREARVRDSTFHVYDHFDKPKDALASGIQRAVNDSRWKLHHYTVNGQTTLRLFDLQNDPDEIHDLSQDIAAAKELSRLQTLLTAQRRELNDNQIRA